MQEDFGSDRATFIALNRQTLPPFIYNNKSNALLDRDTFISPLTETNMVRHYTTLRGGDTFTNTGTETFNHH